MGVSQEMQALTAQVEATDTVIDSAIQFILGLASQVENVAGDKAQSLTLASTLKAKAQTLADAIVANTPSGGSGESSPTAARRG